MSAELCTKLRLVNSVQGGKLLLTFLVTFMEDATCWFPTKSFSPFHVIQLSLGSGFSARDDITKTLSGVVIRAVSNKSEDESKVSEMCLGEVS